MAGNEGQHGQCLGLNMIPERRKNRDRVPAFGIVLICSAATLVLALSSTKDELYRAVFLVALLCLNTVISTAADRLFLIGEERYHLETRYDGNRLKMLSACLSGVKWSIVIVPATTAIAIIAMRPNRRDICVAVLFGLMIAGLTRLFHSNTLSQVEVSRILEDNEKSVANGLAWSYYFGYLEIILPELKERIEERNQSWKFQLSSEKLYILLPLHCDIWKNIQDADGRIAKENDGDLECIVKRGGLDRKYTNKAYCINFARKKQKYRILLEYAISLDTLKKMSTHERIKTITEEERIDQVKIFCQILQGILEDPLNKECQGKCELVIYNSKTLEDQGDGLAGLLVQRIEENKRIEGRPEDRNVQENEGVEEQDNEEQQMIQRDIQEHSELRAFPLPMEETGTPSGKKMNIES